MFDFVETEMLLLKTFGELLKNPLLEPDDNLRDKGLGSLQRVAGAMLLRKHGIQIKPQQIGTSETVRALARELCKADPVSQRSPQHSTQGSSSYPMTPTQRDWQQSGFNEHYNIYGGWSYLAGAFSGKIFAEAVQQLVNSQDELRLRITRGKDALEFSCAPRDQTPYLEHRDLSHLSPEQARAEAVRTCVELQRSFRFDGKSPLCRFIDFRLDQAGNGWVFIIVHHFTVDGFGWGNLLRKISHFYSSMRDGIAPVDIYGGSGVSRLWAETLRNFGQTPNHDELPYWQSLPWESLNCDLRDSAFSDKVSTPVNVFNDDDAARLYYLETGMSLSDQSRTEIFESQATVLANLEPALSRRLLDRAWVGADTDGFDDFDLFSAAVTHALGPYCRSKHLWLDMLAATRSGVFEEIDASGSLGYFSELTPFLAPVCTGKNLRASARAIAEFRKDQPRSGVGFRALKAHAIDSEVQKTLAAMQRPQVGINYHASLLYNFSGTMLNLPQVPEWLGPTMDENGIRYRFWYRVSFANDRLEMVLRYDPARYCIKDGIAIAEGTIAAMIDFLTCT